MPEPTFAEICSFQPDMVSWSFAPGFPQTGVKYFFSEMTDLFFPYDQRASRALHKRFGGDWQPIQMLTMEYAPQWHGANWFRMAKGTDLSEFVNSSHCMKALVQLIEAHNQGTAPITLRDRWYDPLRWETVCQWENRWTQYLAFDRRGVPRPDWQVWSGHVPLEPGLEWPCVALPFRSPRHECLT